MLSMPTLRQKRYTYTLLNLSDTFNILAIHVGDCLKLLTIDMFVGFECLGTGGLIEFPLLASWGNKVYRQHALLIHGDGKPCQYELCQDPPLPRLQLT